MGSPLTDAQRRALEVIDASATGDAVVSDRTSLADFTVSAAAAKALVRLGLCEVTEEVVRGATATGTGYAKGVRMGEIRRAAHHDPTCQ